MSGVIFFPQFYMYTYVVRKSLRTDTSSRFAQLLEFLSFLTFSVCLTLTTKHFSFPPFKSFLNVKRWAGWSLHANRIKAVIVNIRKINTQFTRTLEKLNKNTFEPYNTLSYFSMNPLFKINEEEKKWGKSLGFPIEEIFEIRCFFQSAKIRLNNSLRKFRKCSFFVRNYFQIRE